MQYSLSRRQFLAAASSLGVTAAVAPLAGRPLRPNAPKSRVIAAHDPDIEIAGGRVAGGSVSRVQDIVDHAVMALTGKSGRSEAYEALFPEPVTAETRICLKYNENIAHIHSGQLVLQAVKNGLTSMLDNSYPENRIHVQTYEGSAGGNSPTFQIGTSTYKFVAGVMDADWIINLPGCWNMSLEWGGVTLGLKNMMGVVPQGREGFHNHFVDEAGPSLSVLNSQPTVKNKLVATIMDAIVGKSEGNWGGEPNFIGRTVFASRDMVALDYNAMLLCKDNGLSTQKEAIAREVISLAAQAPWSIGTDNPDEIEVVQISPPYDIVSAVSGRSYERHRIGIEQRGGKIHFIVSNPRTAEPGTVSILSCGGAVLWESRRWQGGRLVWPGCGRSDRPVTPGVYIYRLTLGLEKVYGSLMIYR